MGVFTLNANNLSWDAPGFLWHRHTPPHLFAIWDGLTHGAAASQLHRSDGEELTADQYNELVLLMHTGRQAGLRSAEC